MENISKIALRDLEYRITGAAIEVHKSLGPGLLESAYHECMRYELGIRGLQFRSELKIPILFKGIKLKSRFRCDSFVENIMIVELKSCIQLMPVHKAQVLTYMNLMKVPKGLLFNFHTTALHPDGIYSLVNDLFRELK